MRQWLQNLLARKTSTRGPRSTFRPTLERLGERLVPATFTVTNLNDSGTGSLRQVVIDANAAAGADVIGFQDGLTGTVTLTSGQLGVTDSVTTQGPGADGLAVSGNNASRIFAIARSSGPSLAVAISGLTLTAGNAFPVPNQQARQGGAIRNQENLTLTDCTLAGNSAQEGGGLYNEGTATLTGCTLVGNSATALGGGPHNRTTATLTGCTLAGNSAIQGGGFYSSNRGTLIGCTLTANTARTGGGGFFDAGTGTLVGCTLTANTALNGGGLFSQGTDAVIQCTVSGNSATSQGGGLFFFSTATLTQSTLTGNSATTGGGIYNAALTKMNNTIVANSPAGGDIFSFLSLNSSTCSHNLIEDGSGGLPDTITGDPGLGPLQDNGGATWTHTLLPDSPARNAGDNALAADANGTPLDLDQRGAARVPGGTVDVGAFEVPPTDLFAVGSGAGGDFQKK